MKLIKYLFDSNYEISTSHANIRREYIQCNSWFGSQSNGIMASIEYWREISEIKLEKYFH